MTPLMLHCLYQYTSSVYKILRLYPTVVVLVGIVVECGFDKVRPLLYFSVCWTWI